MNIILLLFHRFLSKTSAAQLDKAGEAIVFRKDLFLLLEFQSAEINFLTRFKYQMEKEWDYFYWYMTSRKSSSFTREGSHEHHSVDFRMEVILEEELDNCSSRFLSGT